jgi:hypothetical protein
LGGFLSEKYLGRPEPRRPDLSTSSLSKYKYVIDQWGGWALFQVCFHTVSILKLLELSIFTSISKHLNSEDFEVFLLQA